MTGTAWLQPAALVACIGAGTRLLGPYLAGVFGDGEPARGDRFFLCLERPIYRLCGIDERREQRWTTYAQSVLAFSAVSVLALYLLRLALCLHGCNACPVGFAFCRRVWL